ncbi:DUF6266 family protein [Pedobacter nyackensis]|uniref:DUF6266 family protein n=1 Tax=Pedobacter nyackensis TaxID=475255 RepID=UPI00292D0264|nr:DUF6266 family protein [Pedobacter nyackensis]
MAKIRKGILGPVSGKIGPVVGATWKGIPYIRTKPKKKKNKKRSPAQIAAQEKLKLMNNILVPFHAYITVGFAHEAEEQTEISAAFSANYHTMISGTYPTLEADYSKLQLSVGNLPMINDIHMELQSLETLKLTWKDDFAKNTAFDDQLMLVVYSRELDMTFGFTGGVNRSQKQCLVQIVEPFVGKTLDVYLSMTSFNRKAIANSVYLGKIG